ncbi:MAG: DUF3800 domain-containing protein [Phycisphaeraceae bacterium]
MYLMYVDDSGDCGMPADGSPSNFFCLSGLVVHELRWKDTLGELARFRRWLRGRYGVNIEDELHAAEMINKPSKMAPSLQRLAKHQRLAIIRHFADTLATLSDVNIINVVVDKRSGRVPNKDEVYRWAWYGPGVVQTGVGQRPAGERRGAAMTAQKMGPFRALGDPTTRITRGSDPQTVYVAIIDGTSPKHHRVHDYSGSPGAWRKRPGVVLSDIRACGLPIEFKGNLQGLPTELTHAAPR